MVQKIVRAGAEGQPHPLAQQDRLEEGRINIEVTRPAEGISWQISEIGLCGCGCKLARSETRRINCRVATDCLHIGIQHIRQYRPTETSRQGGAPIGDTERSSGVRAQDSAGRPRIFYVYVFKNQYVTVIRCNQWCNGAGRRTPERLS